MRIVTKQRMMVCCAILAVIFFAAGLIGLCVPVEASAESVTPKAIVTASEGSAVTEGKLNEGAAASDGFDVTGLTVEGGAGYSAILNGVFKDDVKLDFALLSKIVSGQTTEFTGAGAFTFRVSDAGDPSKYFDIVMSPVNYWGTTFTLPYVQYGNEIRWRQHGADGGGTIFNESVPSASIDAKYSYAFAAIPFAGADRNHESSYIKLSWNEDVLNVSVMCGHNYNTDPQEIIIASFDETAALNSGAKEFGLEKLTGMKENGFTISFGSDYTDENNPENNGTDICLTTLTVGDVSFDLTGSAVFEETPQWYTDYQSRATITLAEEPAAYWNKEVGAYTVPAATYTTVGNSVPQTVADVKLTKDGTKVSISEGKATFTEDGIYTLTYTAIEGSSAVGNTLSYTVNVGTYLPAKDLIDGEGATAGKLNEGATADDGYDVTGLTVEGDAGYSATLNGVFKDDVKLDFALLSKIAAEGGNGFGGKGRLTFRIADAGDPTSYFEIVIRSEDWFGSSRNFAYVQYGDEIRWRVHGANGGGDIFGVDVLENTDMAQYAYAAIPFDGADANTENSYIKLTWTGEAKDILNVSVMCGHDYNANRQEIVIASFDGTASLDNATKAYGLEKLTGMKENGFTISFGSDYTDENNPENNGTDICFKKITVGAKEYDLSAVVLSETDTDWYDAYENIVVWNVAEGAETIPNREYTVREATYSLQDGITEGQTPFKTEYSYLGEDGSTEPSSWQEITGGNFTPTEAGIYEIRYTAVENGTNVNNTYSYRVTVRAVQQIAKPALPEGSNVTYDGKEHSVTIAENDAYTVTGTLSATDADTYTIIVSLKDKVFTEWTNGGTDDVALSWTIAKATPVITAEAAQSAEYDGEAQNVTASIAGVNGEELSVTVTWYSDAAHENALDGAPVNAGTYYAVLSYAGSDNYNAAESVNVAITVTKIQVTVPSAPAQVTYDGEEQTAAVAENAAYTVGGNKQTNAGTYNITVTLTDKTNYEWEGGGTDDITLQWTIAKATPVITAEAAQSAEYDGEAQNVTASIAGVNGEELTVTVTWYSDAQHENELDSAPVDAGTYYTVLSYAEGENYTAAESVNVTYTITKVKVTAPTAPAEVTYNGKEQTAAVADNAAYTISGSKQTKAGTYDITVTLNDAKNYEWSDGTSEALTLQWTIAKATPVITAEAAQSAEYDGEAQDVAASIAGVNGESLTVTVTWYSDAEHENELDGAPVEAGTYYAVLSYSGGDNYTAAQSVNVTFTVTEEDVGPVGPSEPSGTEEPKGLGGGAIAAIVISCVVLVGLSVTLGVLIHKKKMLGKPKKK